MWSPRRETLQVAVKGAGQDAALRDHYLRLWLGPAEQSRRTGTPWDAVRCYIDAQSLDPHA